MNSGPVHTRVSAYAVGGCGIEVRRCDAELNPIVVEIGTAGRVETVGLYMGLDEAERLHALLGAALQDVCEDRVSIADLSADFPKEVRGA